MTLAEKLHQLHSLVRIESLESVLDCINQPLDLLQTEEPSKQLELFTTPIWKKHLWTVFHDFLPAWTMSLSRSTLFTTLWIEDSDTKVGMSMVKNSLPVLLECLVIRDVSLDVLEIYAAGLKRISITAFSVYASLPITNIAFNCSLLGSVPGRLANVLGSYPTQVFYTQWAQLIAQQPSRFSGEFLGKLIRQGHQAINNPHPMIFEKAATIVPADTIYKSLLEHVHHPHQLASLLFSDLDDFLTCALLRLAKWSLANENMARVAVIAAVHAGLLDLEPITEKVIQVWSDPVFIKHSNRHEKEYITLALLVLLGHSKRLRMTGLVKSVSFYFEQGDRATAKLGALVAESVSSKLDKVPLDTGLLEGDARLLEWKKIIWNAQEVAPLQEKEVVLMDYAVEQDEDDEKELDPDASYEPESDEFQAYDMDEEESDDEGTRRDSDKKKYKTPAFIRDLVKYLQDQEDPVKLEIGLNIAETMIRQAAGKGSELEESCELLAKYLISFPETYEMDDFRAHQQKALVALIASVPKKATGYIIDAMYDRNTSVGQSQVILTSITLAVRELAGWENQKKENTQVDDLSNTLGTSLFISKRLDLSKKKRTEKNRLAGLAGPVFFFPLLVGWWEGAQGLIKYWIGNNSLLVERFIMTLNIILHCSTNTPDKRSIVREYFEFALSMRYTNITCKKALLLGIQIIVLESYKDQETLLFQDFTRELIETKDWLDDILENSNEDQLKELTLRILLRLSQINQQQLLNIQ